MANPSDLIARLEQCPAGLAGWREFEDICVEILTFLFVPPLELPTAQARSFSGIDRRDAIFPNRNMVGDAPWAKIFQELDARMVICEFKNYDTSEVGKEEVDQTKSYMRPHFGRLALMITNKAPNTAAHTRRNTLFSDARNVVLFISPEHLKEMLYMKERNEDPAHLILDLLESFYIQHE